jgi:hypothetical protein
MKRTDVLAGKPEHASFYDVAQQTPIPYEASFDVTEEANACARDCAQVRALKSSRAMHLAFVHTRPTEPMVVELVEVTCHDDRLEVFSRYAARTVEEVLDNVSRHPEVYDEVFSPAVVTLLRFASLTVERYRDLVREAWEVLSSTPSTTAHGEGGAP